MKAIILSAGQGRRLLPLTGSRPKCLLTLGDGRSILDLQLDTLAACGVEEVVVAVGFGADAVEARLADRRSTRPTVRTLFNPLFEHSDNLVTAWLTRSEFEANFLLLNGDTLFDASALSVVLEAPAAPISLAIHRKAVYDDDDMKVALSASGQLEAVSKTIPRARVDAESIGLIRFQSSGGAALAAALDEAIRAESALGDWYLSALDSLARKRPIETVDITGHWWDEVDSPADLERVRGRTQERAGGPPHRDASRQPVPVHARQAS